jgi:hypothetical protein
MVMNNKVCFQIFYPIWINRLRSAGGYISFPDFEHFVQQHHEHGSDLGGEQHSSKA